MWKNFNEIKPKLGVEVIAFHHKWIDEDFNPRGIRVGFLADDGFISAFWWDYQDDYIAISKNKVLSASSFYESHLDNTEPEFWCEIDTCGLPTEGAHKPAIVTDNHVYANDKVYVSIDKAVKWLWQHAISVINIEAFRKAMEK